MNQKEKREMKELIWEKLFVVLTGITDCSDSGKDKCAAEAANALVNAMLSLQLVKPDPVELKIDMFEESEELLNAVEGGDDE